MSSLALTHRAAHPDPDPAAGATINNFDRHASDPEVVLQRHLCELRNSGLKSHLPNHTDVDCVSNAVSKFQAATTAPSSKLQSAFFATCPPTSRSAMSYCYVITFYCQGCAAWARQRERSGFSEALANSQIIAAAQLTEVASLKHIVHGSFL